MLVKTILNKIEKCKSFVYEDQSNFRMIHGDEALIIKVRPRRNTIGLCKICNNKCKCYDTLNSRLYEYVPLWGFQVYFEYSPRRVRCPADGIHVEKVPWSEENDHMTKSYKIFLACWAKRLSWKETANIFSTSWNRIYRAVSYVVGYGLTHRNLDNIEQIGVDEIAVFKGHHYLTLVYQIDHELRRLLWCGEHRKVKTLLKFFRWFGKERCLKLKYVCSDMWKPYLKVIKKKAVNALNILDRFHIMKKFNESIDQIRREEATKLVKEGNKNVLQYGRWLLLKNVNNLTEKQTSNLAELLKINLSTVKAYLMKEDFQQFWQYDNTIWADKFLEDWVNRTQQSDIKPMQKIAKMLRKHKELILNWFRSENKLSSGIVEGLNAKAKLTMRKSYGFRTLKCL